MTDDEIAKAKADIEATADLLERAMKLSDFRVLERLLDLKRELANG